jgi:biotin carboxylase
MNVVYLSPHFPPNYYLFCVGLRRLDANVLGIAEDSYEGLRPEVQAALTEYYRVSNMEDYDQVLRAAGYFTHRYGKIDRVESNNEHWLELEGFLRENFNVFGKKIAETAEIKRKSRMKRKFEEAGVEVAPGRLVLSLGEAREFVREVGYPAIAKPDKGVGAASTFRINDDQELESFFRQKPDLEYFMEPFVVGRIVTFDGLADHHGNLVFHTSLQYSRNVMEIVRDDDHMYYYTLRDVPADLVRAGTASVRAFDIREKFFHFEFFRTPDGRLLGLEVNVRPPGWPTTDLFNYANDFDIYQEWANVAVRNRFSAHSSRKYHAIYIGRKHSIRYAHRHEEIVERFGHYLVHVTEMPHAFRRAMGDYAYIARSPSLDELKEVATFVHEKAA